MNVVKNIYKRCVGAATKTCTLWISLRRPDHLSVSHMETHKKIIRCLESIRCGNCSYCVTEQMTVALNVLRCRPNCTVMLNASFAFKFQMRRLIILASPLHVGAPSCGRKEQQPCQGWRRFFRNEDSAHQKIFPWSQTENTARGKACRLGNMLKIKCGSPIK